MTNHLADHVIRARELWVNLCSNGDEAAWDCIHQLVVIRLERHDHRLDLGPCCLASALALSNFTGADGDLIANLEASLQDCATSDTSFESLSILTRFVDIEGANDDHVGRHCELAHWDWDSAKVVHNDIDVVLENGGDRNDRDRAG